MRKSFDGLMAIIRDKYELDPYANALYLFCGRDKRKIKALHFDKDGFVLLQKRLDGRGRFQWPTKLHNSFLQVFLNPHLLQNATQ